MTDDRLFDEDTGEVRFQASPCPNCARALRERVVAEEQLRAIEKEHRKVLAERDRLRTELTGQRQKQDDYHIAHALGRYWILRCDKDPKRTKLGEKRLGKVAARLKDYDPHYIARAIDGLAVYYWTGENGTKHNDLELVCRDEVKLEKYWQLAYDNDAATLITRAWLREWGLEVNHDINELLQEIHESHFARKEKLMPQEYDDELSGMLFKHDKGGNDRAPDYKGRCQVSGEQLQISAWIRTSNRTGEKFMSLAFDRPQAQRQTAAAAAPVSGGDFGGGAQQKIDEEIPFAWDGFDLFPHDAGRTTSRSA